MNTKLVLRLIIIIGLLLIPISVASADNTRQTNQRNKLDPNYQWSPEELARLAEKEKAAEIHAQQSIPIISLGSLNVGPAELYREPNDFAHRNYCGPSSTQVAIRARSGIVPNLEDVARGEYLDPNSGVWINNITPYINRYLGTTWYITSSAGNSTILGNWIHTDIDARYATITGLYTSGMPGWVVSANHIVTVYGYNFTNPNNKLVSYVDTGSEYAGHKYGNGGAYFNSSIPLTTSFWSWVSRDNAQVW
jgi:hypothetical protein